MNIVCVAACTAGIAHTYIAREKLIKGAKALGHNVKVETQEPLVLKMNWRRKILTLRMSLFLPLM